MDRPLAPDWFFEYVHAIVEECQQVVGAPGNQFDVAGNGRELVHGVPSTPPGLDGVLVRTQGED